MQEEQIQAYVFGELSPGEAEAVARAIRDDEKLQEVERHYRQIHSGLRSERIAQLETEVLAFNQTLNTPKKPNQNNKLGGRRQWFFLAFTVLAVLVGGLFYGINRYSDLTLAKHYFIQPQDPRVAGSATDNRLYQEALELFFDDKNYPEAIQTLEQLVEISPNYRTFAIHLDAHALFLAERFPAAVTAFDQLILELDEYPRSQRASIRWNEMIAKLAEGVVINPGEQEWPESFPIKELEKDLGSWLR